MSQNEAITAHSPDLSIKLAAQAFSLTDTQSLPELSRVERRLERIFGSLIPA
jgi:hypothetical protein